MKWLMFCLSIAAFAYQFDCTRSCQEACGKDYICQIECHTCCPIDTVQKQLNCKMCKGYWFLQSCHLSQAGEKNIKPYVYSVIASKKEGVIPFETIIRCHAIDPDGVILQYEWDLNGDTIEDKNSSTNEIKLKINSIGTTKINCRAKDNMGAFSDWNTTTITGEYGLKLKKGWNLASLPTANPLILSNLPNIVIVWKYEEGKWAYYTNNQELSNKLLHLGYKKTIKKLDPKNGYWIYVSTDTVIPCQGDRYTLDLTTLQKDKWYLVGSSDKITTSEMANFSNILIWWTWKDKWFGWSIDATLKNLLWKKGFGFINTIYPSEGFWIKTRSR